MQKMTWLQVEAEVDEVDWSLLAFVVDAAVVEEVEEDGAAPLPEPSEKIIS